MLFLRSLGSWANMWLAIYPLFVQKIRQVPVPFRAAAVPMCSSSRIRPTEGRNG
jgi:hypothetical protein